MAVINDKYKFMFMAEPHTASRSVRDALMTLEGSRETSTYHHCDVPRAMRNCYLTTSQARNYYMFATIRDPHDLLVTNWFIKSNRRDNFHKFIQSQLKEMRAGTLFWRFLPNVQEFMRYEKLQEALNRILTGLGAPIVQLGYNQKYKTPNKTYWKDEWSMRVVRWAESNYPDIKRYGYIWGYNPLDLEPIVKPVID